MLQGIINIVNICYLINVHLYTQIIQHMTIPTPYYLINERALLKNLRVIERVRKASGAKIVLALKCFSTWCVFDTMKPYFDGTTSSSLYEARLGHEKFGKEVHVYSVGFSLEDIQTVTRFAGTIIFNSASQLFRMQPYLGNQKIGLRINPGLSYSHFDLADPARRYSRLGVSDKETITKCAPLITGALFHYNCENSDFLAFSKHLDAIAKTYGSLLHALRWVSLGGGIFFTQKGYPVEKFCRKIQDFSKKFNIQVYLEPGEAVITQCAHLVTTILDITHNEHDIAIIDASTEAHMPDLLIYRQPAKIEAAGLGTHTYTIAGRTCLAGDVFGTYQFPRPLKIGGIIRIADAAGYTMVKKNWFNGIPMPSIVLKKCDGSRRVVRQFTYKDFVHSVS